MWQTNRKYAQLTLPHNGAEITHETGCFVIVQDPLAQLDARVLSNNLLDN